MGPFPELDFKDSLLSGVKGDIPAVFMEFCLVQLLCLGTLQSWASFPLHKLQLSPLLPHIRFLRAWEFKVRIADSELVGRTEGRISLCIATGSLSRV